MSNAPLDPGVLDRVAPGLAEVFAEFADEVGGAATLAEFLEVLGWAVPTALVDFPYPLGLTATLKGNKRYAADRPSRVPELNDHVFEDAREHAAAVVRATDGTPEQFAAALLQVLRTGAVELADVDPTEVRKLVVSAGKAPRPVPGDVLAIPVAPHGYRLAVVLTRNQFGTALGLFDGVSPDGRPDARLLAAPGRFPVYTEESLLKDGTWRVVGHDEGLLARFPANPEIYHRPRPGGGTGEFGAAETVDGALRLVDEEEARAVGLADNTYRQTMTAAFLQKVLTERAGAGR
ncbi:hypothetical protein [Saccharothrix syringae]|uniref:Uncharacterized protein n=1 Tax=Saccharothrix syringae TaxID=103733 RepID=A0A5Q0H5N8_SACSY|nr:hypothetical protein [Saccharothrix syringae]QFZ21303.1 hypothetical protein EKG83_31440 [Saccharothrix syringae]